MNTSEGRRDLVLVVLMVGVPYALAILVQDTVIPWVDTAGTSDLLCVALGVLVVILGVLWLRVRRRSVIEAKRMDDVERALVGTLRDLRSIERALAREVCVPVRHLATTAKWLLRSSPIALDHVTRSQLESLTARAELVNQVLERIVVCPNVRVPFLEIPRVVSPTHPTTLRRRA